METAILRQRDILIVTLEPSPTDSALANMRDALLEKARELRSRGVVLDLCALDILDSFACRSVRLTVEALRLQGTEAVVVGIRPELAIAMVQMGLSFRNVQVALDLDEGLDCLERRAARKPHGK